MRVEGAEVMDGKEKKKYVYVRKTKWYNGHKFEGKGKTEKEALIKLAEKIAAAKRGEGVVSENMTVDAWFALWLKTYKTPKGLTAKSLSMYEEKYRLYIKPEIGALRLRDVKDIQLQAILNGQAGKSASHVKKIRMVIQAMFRRARQSRLIVYDPAELLEIPSVTEGHRRSLTEEERASVLLTAERHPRGLWVLTLLYTGMRPGESAALRWGDVDFERGEIHVREAKESGNRRLKEPKTDAGNRDIPIHDRLRPLLEAARGLPGEYVFPGPGGKVADDNALRRWWKSFLRTMDMERGATVYRNKIIETTLAPDLKLYCLRHTFATDLQRAGVSLTVAKDLMGHSDISMTAHYTHKDNALLHDAIKKLSGLSAEGDS